MIILDLYSTHEEQFTRTHSYFGQPFIFNDLSNFGGNPGLFGHIETVNRGPSRSHL
jgi:alpha-N-acetylglucosaminidase